VSRFKIIGARQRKQWDKVKYYAQKQLDLEPGDLFAIDAIGEALEKQGFVDEALQQYERAILADRPRYFIDKHTFLLKRLDILYHRGNRSGGMQA